MQENLVSSVVSTTFIKAMDSLVTSLSTNEVFLSLEFLAILAISEINACLAAFAS